MILMAYQLHQGLFKAKRLGNYIHYIYIFCAIVSPVFFGGGGEGGCTQSYWIGIIFQQICFELKMRQLHITTVSDG